MLPLLFLFLLLTTYCCYRHVVEVVWTRGLSNVEVGRLMALVVGGGGCSSWTLLFRIIMDIYIVVRSLSYHLIEKKKIIKKNAPLGRARDVLYPSPLPFRPCLLHSYSLSIWPSTPIKDAMSRVSCGSQVSTTLYDQIQIITYRKILCRKFS